MQVRFAVRTLDGALVETGGGWADPEAVGGSGDAEAAPLSFEQGDVLGAAVLPCIDAAVREMEMKNPHPHPHPNPSPSPNQVREMKMGEVDLISAPAAWAYGADGFGAEGKPVASDVHVELELVDFVRAKEPYELELLAKLRLQETRKEQGNAHFKRGGLERALQLYQRSLTVVQASDLSDARGGRQGDIRRYREISPMHVVAGARHR